MRPHMRPRSLRQVLQFGLPALLIFSVLLSTFWPAIGNAVGNTAITNRSLTAMPNRTLNSEIYIEPGFPAEQNRGLELILSGGRELPSQAETIPLAPAEPLSAAQIEAIYDRLPPLELDFGDITDFRFPAETLPRPQTGDVLTQTFPAPGDGPIPPAETTGPLEVLRFAPEGEVPLAPFVNVTFNQPMVPLGTIEQLSALDVPVRITPEIPGVWKWIGTRSLVFQADDSVDGPSGMAESQSPRRFPMATEFTVEVPADTTSATGNTLDETVAWTFRTPPPTLTDRYPLYGPQPRDPVIFAAFDQAIDPAAVLESISVTAGGQSYPLRLATAEEISATTRLDYAIQRSQADRWLAFRPTEQLPANTTVAVNIGPGTPSAEGPLTTTEVQSFSFQTYGPLRLDRAECGWGGNCPPLQPFYLRFTNPLDVEQFDPAWIQVTPEIPGQTVDVFDTNIIIGGLTEGRTTYQITIDAALQDIFGQILGEERTVTIETGSAPRSLSGPSNTLITVDPTLTNPVYTFYSINHDRLRVRILAVEPEDWPAYLEYARQYRWDDVPTPPGREVENRIFSINGAEDTLIETEIDLRGALGNSATGQLIVIVDRPPAPFNFGQRNDRAIIANWVQVTQIGLDAFVDHSDMLVWATALRDGTPLPDVNLRLLNTNRRTGTDAAGLGRFSLSTDRTPLLIASRGGDTAILPPSLYAWYDDGWQANPRQDYSRWFVFDDRALYRPGETVHLKGWIRRVGADQTGDISLRTGASNITYEVMDPRGNLLDSGSVDVTNLGGFDLSFTLPEGANLGEASVYLAAQGGSGNIGSSYYHTFQIQEFRRPEFEVRTQTEEMGPFFLGGDTTVSVSAQYFAGGSLPNAETTWWVSSQSASYSPPNWSDFTFGRWTPWWFSWYEPETASDMGQEYTGSTDAAGFHYLNIAFPSAETPQPYTVNAEAVVMDVNRQAWASTTSFLVHPADLYVGLRTERTFVNRGDPLDVDAIVTDLDGNAQAGVEIAMRTVRLDWETQNGRWEQVEVDPQECSVLSGAEPVTCTFDTTTGGEYRITATVTDTTGRPNETQITRWVSGGQRPPVRNVEREEVVLIPDKESYQPGDVAEILVQSPFAPASGLLSLRRSGMLETIPFQMDASTHVLQIPIEDAYIPNLHIAVDLAGNAPRTDDQGDPRPDLPTRPAYGGGELELSIPPATRALSVTVEPAVTALQPGETTALDITVTDAAGAPVANAEMAVVVVDEAVLALTAYELDDPLDVFYQSRDAGVSSVYGRAHIVLASPETVSDDQAEVLRAEAAPAPTAAGMAFDEDAADMAAPAMEMAAEAEESADDGAEQDADGPITIRTDFNPLAIFAPAVNTDASGRATVEVRVPDNLTRYRIMVVAVEGDNRFGSAETNITARLPLMVRPSAPRFLNFGDSFELPVVLQNQTDADMTVDLAIRAGNLNLPEGSGQRVVIPANDRREVRFPALTQQAGNVRLQIAAVAGDYADAASVALPVYTPATSEAFAVYGVIDEGAVVQPILSPQNVWPQFGGLEIATSSTALQALTDSVLYLVSYPFECSEQLASRILAVAALRDVLTAFEAEGLPAPAEIEAAVQRDIARLADLQNSDGGFPVWTRGRESWPFYSIHVAHALQRAAEKGFDVPADMQNRVLDHIRNIEAYFPHWYGPETRHALSSYAVYVRALMGDVDTVKARNLLNQYPLDDQSLEAIAWLWQVLSNDRASASEVEEIRRYILNRAVETPAAANFITSYGDDAYLMLHSNRRTDAIILDALIQDTPDSDLIPKVVAGLLAHRSRGHWNNTQENVFVLIALDRYFNTFESVTPDFVANIWLGDTYAGGHEFQGYSTETRQTEIPMHYLTDGDPGADSVTDVATDATRGSAADVEVDTGETQDLVIAKEGDGRLYYRLGMRYAPTSLELDPLEMGFVVQRSYAAVDDPEDVYLDENGVWHFKAGARVRVTINMVAPSRRYHVALVDPLPAGLEIINPALAVSESVPADPDAERDRFWWWGPWYEHQNLRDQRAEAFTTLLWDGVYEYSYVARATTPGEFVVPPAKAEEMYSPEVFGRSGTDRVIIE